MGSQSGDYRIPADLGAAKRIDRHARAGAYPPRSVSLLGVAGLVFLALFTLDGLVSASDEALRALAGTTALGSVRHHVASIVVMAAPLAAVCCALSPRWPARVYLLPILATAWLALGALPVSMAVAPRDVAPLLCALQLGVAALSWTLLGLAIRRSGGLGAFSDTRAAWSPKRLAVFAVASILAAPLGPLGYGALALASWIEAATDGFVEMRAGGVSIADRRYVRGDQEVRLVGMMHLGDGDAYDALFDSFRGESTLVLEEGVTDREHRIRGLLSYGKAARALGLDEQGSISAYVKKARESAGDGTDETPWPDVRHADIDAAALSPSTLAFVERAFGVWGSDHPLTALRDFMRHPPSQAEIDLALHEIVGMRNEHLLEELERGLRSHRRLIVPWGALHLPEIARAIEEDGFARVQESRRLLVSWSSVLAATLRGRARE
jgi:hypothetical protein